MKKKISLLIIMIISIIGILFSGYLSVMEIFRDSCILGGCSAVGGIPACIYGFFMYFLIFVLSFLGYNSLE